jgi:hypothetical protein
MDPPLSFSLTSSHGAALQTTSGLDFRIELWYRLDERFRVVVRRTDAHFLRRTLFYDVTVMEDNNPLSEMSDHDDVVRDEEAAEGHLALEIDKQVEDPRLYRDVQGAQRFVTDQQTGFRG